MELHDAFTRWLISGQRGSLPRDVAVHASACPGCLRATAAFDALVLVDASAAPEPPVVEAFVDQRDNVVRGALWAAGATAVLAVAVAGVMAMNGVFTPAGMDVAGASLAASPSASLSEGVLGNQGSPRSSASDRPSPSAESSARASGEDDPSPGSSPGTAGPAPSFLGQPLPPGPVGPSASPSARSSAAPGTSPRATATATATPIPTARPTPTPTPTPTPIQLPACSNFADDDGDGLIDFGQDPGCESASDNDETDPDTDGDGVPDHLDECPLEPRGLLPDPFRPGCPLLP